MKTIHVTPETIRQARTVMIAYAATDERALEFFVRLALATGLTPKQAEGLTREIAALRMPS